MKINKLFVQKHVSHDCEARSWNWEDTNDTYEALVEKLAKEWDGWFDGVRVIEKIFDDETFKITTKPIKKTERAYENYSWNGKVEETVYE